MRKPAFAAFQRAAPAAPIECGGTVDTGTPQITLRSRRPTAQQYLTTLPIYVRATDDQGVTDIDLLVDGKEIPLKTVRSGTGASVRFEWGGAKELAYGPHTLVADATDEGKNVGTRERQGHPRRRRRVHATRSRPLPPHGRQGQSGRKVNVQRQDRLQERPDLAPGPRQRLRLLLPLRHQGKRWKKISRYRKDAKKAFSSATSSRSAACGA